MAADFDYAPIYDSLTKVTKDKMSEIWIAWITTHLDTLLSYLSQFGIFVPRLTTSQRDSIQDPQDGQLIYNSTLQKFQGREAGAWVNLI